MKILFETRILMTKFIFEVFFLYIYIYTLNLNLAFFAKYFIYIAILKDLCQIAVTDFELGAAYFTCSDHELSMPMLSILITTCKVRGTQLKVRYSYLTKIYIY